MNIVPLYTEDGSTVSRVSVQVSEYSECNGGAEKGMGTLYAVEVLFPDGKWSHIDYYRDLYEALLVAGKEASARQAILLRESVWPNRKVAF